VATLVNGLANALGENGHTESDDDVHSYELQLEVPKQFECRFQAPTPVGVGWMEQDPTARVKKHQGLVGQNQLETFWIFCTEIWAMTWTARSSCLRVVKWRS